MTHIPGHVDRPPRSAGALHFEVKGATYELLFIPPPFALTKGIEIGFHPVKIDANTAIATDIVLWQNHADADAIVIDQLKDKVEKFHRRAGIAKLRNLISQNYFTEEEKEVIRKTINYFQTPDFNTFYFKAGATEPDPDYAAVEASKLAKRV